MAKKKSQASYYLDFVADQPLVAENVYRDAQRISTPLPSFAEARDKLPEPMWEGHDAAIEAYWRVWELAFGNIRHPQPLTGFVCNFIDTAFNDCLFLWDTCFILMFTRYGNRAFHFQQTLDNLYAAQRDDGFITRERQEWDGQARFHPHDPVSTGPNVFAWAEWEYFQQTADHDRLARIFPVLLAYHRWMRTHRSWPSGAYWSCGLACGMDNQPRLPENYDVHVEHGHMCWIDATAQAAFSADLLQRMAQVLGREDEVSDLREENEQLTSWINDVAWDEVSGFYYDVRREGSISGFQSIAGFWPLLAGQASAEQAARLVEHLEDEKTFNRYHRVPSMSASDSDYEPTGAYWRGSVWPPTTYMILRGLTRYGYDDLAHAIARNHHDNVMAVYNETGTVWENYAPEKAAPGQPAKRDFVGWGGLGPVAVLFEYIFGLRPDVSENRLVWDVRLTEGHGVKRYPFGTEGVLDLYCPGRQNPNERPEIDVQTNIPLEVELIWSGGRETISVSP